MENFLMIPRRAKNLIKNHHHLIPHPNINTQQPNPPSYYRRAVKVDSTTKIECENYHPTNISLIPLLNLERKFLLRS